jgi:sarcosine oxidase subunit alpha
VNIEGCSHVRACMTPVQENMKAEMAKGYFDIRNDNNGL